MSPKFIFLISKVISYCTQCEDSKEMLHMGQGHLRNVFGGKCVILENTPEINYSRFKEKMNKCENEICKEL